MLTKPNDFFCYFDFWLPFRVKFVLFLGAFTFHVQCLDLLYIVLYTTWNLHLQTVTLIEITSSQYIRICFTSAFNEWTPKWTTSQPQLSPPPSLLGESESSGRGQRCFPSYCSAITLPHVQLSHPLMPSHNPHVQDGHLWPQIWASDVSPKRTVKM